MGDCTEAWISACRRGAVWVCGACRDLETFFWISLGFVCESKPKRSERPHANGERVQQFGQHQPLVPGIRRPALALAVLVNLLA